MKPLLAALALFLAATAARAGDVPAPPPLLESAERALPPPDPAGSTFRLGAFSSALGGTGGCLAGLLGPGACIGASSAGMAWLYGQAALGLCLGVAPALLALGGAGGICASALVIAPCAACLGTAGAAGGALREGRSGWPALLGGTPGVVIAVLGTVLVVVGFFTATGLAAVVPAVVIMALGALLALSGGPTAVLGAFAADALFGGAPGKLPPDPVDDATAAVTGLLDRAPAALAPRPARELVAY